MALMNCDIHSPWTIIREGYLERLKTIPQFQNVKWFRNRGKGPYQPENLPLIAVYDAGESLVADGDGNHGHPKFTHTCKFGFQIIVQSNDNEVAELSCKAAVWSIMRSLEYQAWWEFPVIGNWQYNQWLNPPRIVPLKIEAVTRGEIPRVNFGPSAGNNEAPYCEQVFEMTITFRSYFDPIVPDDLDLIHVTVAYPWPFDPNRNEPFGVVYDLVAEDGLPTDPVTPPPNPAWWPQPPLAKEE